MSARIVGDDIDDIVSAGRNANKLSETMFARTVCGLVRRFPLLRIIEVRGFSHVILVCSRGAEVIAIFIVVLA